MPSPNSWDLTATGSLIDLGNSDSTIQSGAAGGVSSSDQYGTLSEPSQLNSGATDWGQVLTNGLSMFANYDLTKQKIQATIPTQYDRAGYGTLYRLDANGNRVAQGSVQSGGGLLPLLLIGAVMYIVLKD